MPEIDSKVRDQLLLHQIVASLPIPVSKQLRAANANARRRRHVLSVVARSLGHIAICQRLSMPG